MSLHVELEKYLAPTEKIALKYKKVGKDGLNANEFRILQDGISRFKQTVGVYHELRVGLATIAETNYKFEERSNTARNLQWLDLTTYDE